MVLLHDLQSFGMFMRVGRSFVPSDLRAVLSAMKDAYVSYFRLRNMALYDFKSEQDLEDIYLKNNRK